VRHVTANFNNAPSVNTVGAFPIINSAQVLNVGTNGSWEIYANIADLNYDLRLYTAGFTGLVDDLFYALRRPTGSNSRAAWTMGGGFPPDGAPGRTVASGYAEVLGVTTFSEHSIGTTDIPMPVQWLAFSARPATSWVDLHWSVADQQRNQGFRVQRSADARSFTTLGFVPGDGNLAGPRSFNFRDDQAVTTRNRWYYRLIQEDLDGTQHPSNVVEVRLAGAQDGFGQPYPNPANAHLTLPVQLAESARVQVQLLNALGQVVYSADTEVPATPSAQLQLPTQHLAAGLYQLVARSGATQATFPITIAH
jgi:hypothetical protein